jgi:hypothetical protein
MHSTSVIFHQETRIKFSKKTIFDFADQYSNAKEELVTCFPIPVEAEMEVNIYFDSDHAYDKRTGR